jgi:hypothetical protein
MARLIIWIAAQNQDSGAYNLISKTKKGLLDKISESKISSPHMIFEEPKKTVIQYKDAFDLFDQCTGEGGGRYSESY